MINISVEDVDNIDRARAFLIMINTILMGWHKGADEINIEYLKSACGDLWLLSYEHIQSLEAVGNFSKVNL
ncbi:hypothetical protein ACLH6Q_001335 [Campylobacter fetus]|uniref:hypothetical protein n=1 Tax=Campylobacter fetus TaxID=196 RepID=UPI0008189AA2|nr:hypothetical protein [Campylobacter fetus]EAH8299629.1 hypothetical protein [Campylobacter fetus]EAI7232227.1 hypothetical protein [Campylobacter fetus]EAJ5690942.1 hypothetical protein [Campylobacter fetus]EAK0427734.1 hypothetical protein [Campylobacter fetus]EAK5305430.1 hypothetical protein [Campylobacter fetus]